MNTYKNEQLEGLIIVGRGRKSINRAEKECFLVSKADIFPDATFHVATKNFRVDAESETGRTFEE